MDSPDELHSEHDEFLKEIANICGFNGDEQVVLMKRFAPISRKLQHKEIIGNLWKEDYEKQNDKNKAAKNRRQKFTDKLNLVSNKISAAFEHEGCPIKKQKTRGRSPSNESYWQQVYDWLWQKKFPKWQDKQNNRMDANAAPIDLHDTCQRMLDLPRQATSNNGLDEYEDAKFEREQIYVPLALVERTKPDKRSNGEYSPAAGSRVYEPQYEEKQRFEHEDFLTQILESGQGKSKGTRIALIGEPGSGKTTLLRCIAFWVLEKNLGYPIRISLADLERSANGNLQTYLFRDWLSQAFPPTQLNQAKEELIAQIQQGRVWLLLDGVDEVTVSGMQTLYALSQQFIGWIAPLRVVLTCRLNVWQGERNDLEAFETYRLLDFDYPKQVHQFIDNWFGNLKSDCLSQEKGSKAEQLKAQLDEAERGRLQNLVQNPLLLKLLCEIWQREEGNLPQTKAGLYHQYVQQIYKWNKNRFRIKTEEQKELNNALGRLAQKDIQEGSSRFRLLESFISKELGAPDEEKSLFDKALQLGWLNHVGIAAESRSKEKVYAFLHPTFEEYFAALAINDWHFFLNHIPGKPNHPDASYRIFEPKWKEVILLWLGRKDVPSKQKEQFIQALVEFDDGCGDFYWYRAYLIAAEGIAEFRDCSRAEEIVEDIVRNCWVIAGGPIIDELWAVLLKTEHKIATKTLEEAIEDGKVSEPERVADTLLKIDPGNPRAIRMLVSLIRNCKHDFRHMFILDTLDQNVSLGNISSDDRTAIEALTEAIPSLQNEKCRVLAAAILGRINPGSSLAIEVLEQSAKKSQDESTRSTAAEKLWDISPGNSTSINVLHILIKNSQHEYIRRQAAEIVLRINPDDDSAIQALKQSIQNPQNELVRCLSAEIVLRINPDDDSAIPALEQLIQDSPDEFVCRRATQILLESNPNSSRVIEASHRLRQISQEAISNSISILVDYIYIWDEYVWHGEDNEIFGDADTRAYNAQSTLEEILPEAQMPEFITTLRHHLPDETDAEDCQGYHCDQVLWRCAQTLPYPTFYQAWHSSQLTSHPKVLETTGVGFTPNSQSLNLAKLPKLLQTALDSNSDLSTQVQLICINGNKFIDRDNPTIKVYNEMRSQGCPNYWDGKPETMVQLQDYWDELRQNSDRVYVLVFYENPTAAPQGFSETFLDALSRFDGMICVISDQPNIPLQSFSPNQPNLEINVVEWIRKIVLENP